MPIGSTPRPKNFQELCAEEYDDAKFVLTQQTVKSYQKQPPVPAIPSWAIYAIIIIGAVLVIALIVLILTTRRPV